LRERGRGDGARADTDLRVAAAQGGDDLVPAVDAGGDLDRVEPGVQETVDEFEGGVAVLDADNRHQARTSDAVVDDVDGGRGVVVADGGAHRALPDCSMVPTVSSSQ
jgi:hypothetical protein